jgi:ribosomal protein L32
MLGISFQKIILLAVIVLVIWYGFKLIEKRTHIKENKPSNKNKNKNKSKFKADNVQDLEKCDVCNNYFLSGSSCPECNSPKG